MVMFFSAIFGSLLDPLALAGYVAAGFLIKPRWISVLAGIAWRFLLQIFLVMPSMKSMQMNPSGEIFVASLFGAALATFIFHLIATAYRRKKAKLDADSLK